MNPTNLNVFQQALENTLAEDGFGTELCALSVDSSGTVVAHLRDAEGAAFFMYYTPAEACALVAEAGLTPQDAA